MIWGKGGSGTAGIFLDAENSRTNSAVGALSPCEIRDFDFHASGLLRRTF